MRTSHLSKQCKKAWLKLARLLKNKALLDVLVLLLRVAAIVELMLPNKCEQLSDTQRIDQTPNQSVDEVLFEPSHHDING